MRLATEVKAAMRAGFWKVSLLEPAASGAVAALEASMSLATEVVAGCTDDWAAPEVASARLAAQHLAQVLAGRCSTARSPAPTSVTTVRSLVRVLAVCWSELAAEPLAVRRLVFASFCALVQHALWTLETGWIGSCLLCSAYRSWRS